MQRLPVQNPQVGLEGGAPEPEAAPVSPGAAGKGGLPLDSCFLLPPLRVSPPPHEAPCLREMSGMRLSPARTCGGGGRGKRSGRLGNISHQISSIWPKRKKRKARP